MTNQYDVHVWKIQTRYRNDAAGRRKPSRYVVRWRVSQRRFEKSYKLRAQADSFRSELLTAAKKGEPFDLDKGVPRATLRASVRMTWLELARQYVDLKWDDSAPKTRKSTADNLVAITRSILADKPGEPAHDQVGRALRVAFNKIERQREPTDEIRGVMRWIEDSSPMVSEIADTAEIRRVIAALDRTRDGNRAATDTVRLRRLVLRSTLDLAVEQQVLRSNPFSEIKVKKHRSILREVDRRSVANPTQARTLLLAVRETNRRLEAFFAVMYYAGLRPEEATNLRVRELDLPDRGWGDLHLRHAAPEIGREWTDSGQVGEERALKHRGVGVGRTVPCPPALTEILHTHIRAFGTTFDGRLFRAMRTDAPLASSVYGRVWSIARAATFTDEVLATPLAKRPYDLRHAAVSTWLNATGDPTRVAEWAGHTVSVLLRVYAKCLDGGETDARKRVAERLGGV